MAATREAGFGPEVKRRIILGTYALSSGYYDAYYGQAQKVRTLISRDFAAAFEQADVLVSPTTPTTAFPIGDKIDDPLAMYLNDLATIPTNLAGTAALSVPCGLAGRRPAGRPAGDGPGARRGRHVPGRGRLRGRPQRRRRRPADPPRSGGVPMTAPTLIDFDEVVERFDPMLGIEVHVELNTNTKMFCGCPTAFGAEPNTQVCPTCLGLPGSLPVVNRTAVESAIRIGLALNCDIAPWGRFARKNYFYPDMPKNFQTSQYDEPIAVNGYLDVLLDDGSTFRVEIERAHMEEDTGKSLHVGGATGRIHGAEYSLLDYNRAGVPLIEIVTKMIPGTRERAPEVARAYVTALRDLVRVARRLRRPDGPGLDAGDVNLSLSPRDSGVLGTRTETKNVNSLRSVERAVRYEMTRQAGVLLAGDDRRPGDAALRGGHGHHAPWPSQGDRGGLPVLPGARPGADRAARRVGRGAARHPAGAAVGAAQAAPGGLVAHRRGAARPGQRRCARPHRGHGRRGRACRRGPLVVGVVPDAAGQHPRRGARRAADHAGPGGAGDRARRFRRAEQQARPAGRRRRAGGRGRARRRRRRPAGSRSSPTRVRWSRPSTRRWPPSRTSPRRSAAARCRRRARSSAPS